MRSLCPRVPVDSFKEDCIYIVSLNCFVQPTIKIQKPNSGRAFIVQQFLCSDANMLIFQDRVPEFAPEIQSQYVHSLPSHAPTYIYSTFHEVLFALFADKLHFTCYYAIKASIIILTPGRFFDHEPIRFRSNHGGNYVEKKYSVKIEAS